MLRAILILLIWMNTCCLFAQKERALLLRDNVVAISSPNQNGFGFITGERNNELLIVTASHVVNVEMKPTIRFFDDFNVYTGKVIFHEESSDIAVIKVVKPKLFTWLPFCLAAAKEEEDVAYVGKDGEWYIPTRRFLGAVNNIKGRNISLDLNGVNIGSSGAPVISSDGIIGMVVQADSGNEVRAIAIGDIKTKLTGQYKYFFQLKATNTVIDPAGNIYLAEVLRDGRYWTVQNLNFKTADAQCYDNDPLNCDNYGRLYTWEGARKACMELGEGWRLPTRQEWIRLSNAYGGIRMYDEDSSFQERGNAERSFNRLSKEGQSDFKAAFGGLRQPGGDFSFLGIYGDYWSDTPIDEQQSWYFFFSKKSKSLNQAKGDKNAAISCRCILEEHP